MRLGEVFFKSDSDSEEGTRAVPNNLWGVRLFNPGEGRKPGCRHSGDAMIAL